MKILLLIIISALFNIGCQEPKTAPGIPVQSDTLVISSDTITTAGWVTILKESPESRRMNSTIYYFISNRIDEC